MLAVKRCQRLLRRKKLSACQRPCARVTLQRLQFLACIALHRGERRKKGIQFRLRRLFLCLCLPAVCKIPLGTRAGERILRKPAAKRLRALAERPRLIERLIARKSRPDASRQRLRKRQVSGVLLFQLLLSSLERLPFGELLR